MIDFKVLKGVIPSYVLNELEKNGADFGVTSKIRLAHLLSQVEHESGNFKVVEENLRYTEKRLLQVFPKYFNESNSIYYAMKPEKIANKVYASRMGNRNEKSGDGWLFRGRGYLQLTGAENYVNFGKAIKENLVKYPDLVSTKYPLTSALWFFKVNNIWDICDKGIDVDTIKKVTKKVNGGTNGLKSRVNSFNKYIKILEIV